jgi:hypothetical protein
MTRSLSGVTAHAAERSRSARGGSGVLAASIARTLVGEPAHRAPTTIASYGRRPSLA